MEEIVLEVTFPTTEFKYYIRKDSTYMANMYCPFIYLTFSF